MHVTKQDRRLPQALELLMKATMRDYKTTGALPSPFAEKIMNMYDKLPTARKDVHLADKYMSFMLTNYYMPKAKYQQFKEYHIR